MNRRAFLATAALGSAAAIPLPAQNYSDYSKDPRPDVAEGATRDKLTVKMSRLDGTVLQVAEFKA